MRFIERWSMPLLQTALALMAIVSLNPYFIWGHQKVYYAIASILIVAAAAGCRRALILTPERLALCAAFSLFLIYLSVLPKVDGGTTRWFFLIPFTAVLLLVSELDLRLSFEKFHLLFVFSLLPGMVVWIWLAAGLPLELQYMTPPTEVVQREMTPYFTRPGLVFLPTNGMLLPGGGTIFRLCGVYDEPGTVGTIAALCLAVTRFRLSNVHGAICFLSGLMSLSVAFAVLMTIGLVATALAARQFRLLPWAVVCVLVGLVPATGVAFRNNDPHRLTSIILVVPSTERSKSLEAAGVPPSTEKLPTAVTPFGLWDDVQTRQSMALDNRMLPSMRRLLSEYAGGGPGTLLFGIASNASNVRAGESASWTQILTNYGAVGFGWLFLLFAAPLWWLWRSQRLDLGVALLCLLFLMSFYQRPVIWLPAQMLMYFAGLFYPAPSKLRSSS